jgi:transposase
MSLRPHTIEPVPELTARIARAAFPKGNLYLQMRDELGTLYTDQDFAALYPRRGKPALQPWRLALVTVMQFVENLSDRQAAEAVRARIDWKYALSLALDDPGFDFSLLSEFRERLVAGNAEQLLLDRLLDLFRDKKLLKARGRQRTDSTHVLAAIRAMNRLELVTETLRATLNEVATVAPDWLRSIAPADWYARYSLRAEQWRLPKGEKARQEFGQTVAQDGFLLLSLLDTHKPQLKTLAKVQTLIHVWERHFARSEVGGVQLREEKTMTRAAEAISSPYDTQARYSNKDKLHWTGYKVHLTETCEADLPHLITQVHTTVATTQDVSCTAEIQQALADKELLPSRHLVDTGYVDADLLVSSQKLHQIKLFGPPRDGNTWQAREGGYTPSQFAVDWQKQQVTCPQGKVSRSWQATKTKRYAQPVVMVRFGQRDCLDCQHRAKCVRSAGGRSRALLLREQTQHEALQQMRSQITQEQGRQEYQQRAGIEGTLSQGIRRCDLRQARYWGLPKTRLQHLATAAGLNVLRATDYLRAKPTMQTRISRFARLAA